MARLARTHRRTDVRGRHPEAGDTVVANVSGQLHAGIVKGIGSPVRSSRGEVGVGAIYVELFDGWYGRKGHVSKIRDPRSVYVIRPGDCGDMLEAALRAEHLRLPQDEMGG